MYRGFVSSAPTNLNYSHVYFLLQRRMKAPCWPVLVGLLEFFDAFKRMCGPVILMCIFMHISSAISMEDSVVKSAEDVNLSPIVWWLSCRCLCKRSAEHLNGFTLHLKWLRRRFKSFSPASNLSICSRSASLILTESASGILCRLKVLVPLVCVHSVALRPFHWRM